MTLNYIYSTAQYRGQLYKTLNYTQIVIKFNYLVKNKGI